MTANGFEQLLVFLAILIALGLICVDNLK